MDALDDAPGIRRVIGIDVVDPGAASRHLEFYRLDVQAPELADVLHGADAVVHLAAETDPRDQDRARGVNVGGTANVLRAAAAAGVGTIVFVSTAMVYGAHPDNDFPLTERSPVRPVQGVAASDQKADAEELVRDFAAAHPQVRVAILRLAPVMGPNVAGAWARFIESPLLYSVDGYGAPFQPLHEADAVAALRHVLERGLAGVYNVAPDDHIEADELTAMLGERRFAVARVALPADAARTRLERSWRLGTSLLPPGSLPFLMYPWVLSGAEFRDTGFTPQRSARDALAEAIAARRGWVTVGPLRFRPRRVLAAAGAALLMAGTAGRAMAGVSRGRRRSA